MINQDLIERTAVGKVAKRFNIKFNWYYTFAILINLFAFFLCLWDVKGIAILLFTLGFTLVLRLLLTTREEQRITNELLEEILSSKSPIR